ncbi:hypothetical protein ACH5AO_18685 [Streptomyces sp. NPDC018964]|uniref:hypothetical protein n=1 Tax=unclassified Streptomyces TaxID=2593676 RepID=UPI00378B1ECD
MGERRVRKMLRQMESGEPVRVVSPMGSMKKLARIASFAQQFGYEYADIRQGGGAQGKGLTLLLVPDPGPAARERAARNRARYPRAADGGELPRPTPEEVELLKARIGYDLATQYTDKQRVALSVGVLTVLALAVALKVGAHTTGLVVVGAVWAALMALVPVGITVNRRYREKQIALLRAAGLTPVTEPGGRVRYVPPGGRLPGQGNPFAR